MSKRYRKAIQAIAQAKTAAAVLAAATPAGLVSSEGRVVLTSPIQLKFERVDLSLVDFRGVSFKGNRFVNCHGAGARFFECTFNKVWFAAEKTGTADFTSAEFGHCSFEDTSFGAARMNLSGVRFTQCSFKDCTFRLPQLQGSVFERCHMDYVALRSGDLRGATFPESVLRKVDFSRSKMEGVDFSTAVFHEADFWGPENPGAEGFRRVP